MLPLILAQLVALAPAIISGQIDLKKIINQQPNENLVCVSMRANGECDEYAEPTGEEENGTPTRID